MTDLQQRQSGQIALIVLLILVVTFVVAVSLAQRTSQDIALTTKQAETARVFSAAQSGAEQKLTEVLEYLRNGGSPPADVTAVINDSDLEVTVLEVSNFTQNLDEGETYQVNLSAPSTVVLEWGDSSGICANEASILIGRYYEPAPGTMEVQYSGYYPNCGGVNPHPGDGFQSASGGASGGRRNRVSVTANPGDLFLRVVPMYASIGLYIENAADQQYVITSSAVNQLGDDQESRVVEVTTSDFQPPSFLDYTVYSGTNLVK